MFVSLPKTFKTMAAFVDYVHANFTRNEFGEVFYTKPGQNRNLFEPTGCVQHNTVVVNIAGTTVPVNRISWILNHWAIPLRRVRVVHINGDIWDSNVKNLRIEGKKRSR